MYQEGAYCFAINIFNNLPSEIKKIVSQLKQFSLPLSDFLHLKSLYTLDKYFNSTKVYDLVLIYKCN